MDDYPLAPNLLPFSEFHQPEPLSAISSVVLIKHLFLVEFIFIVVCLVGPIAPYVIAEFCSLYILET